MLPGPHATTTTANGTVIEGGGNRNSIKQAYGTGFIFGGGMIIIFLSILIKKRFFEAFYRLHIIIAVFIIIMCIVHPAP